MKKIIFEKLEIKAMEHIKAMGDPEPEILDKPIVFVCTKDLASASGQCAP